MLAFGPSMLVFGSYMLAFGPSMLVFGGHLAVNNVYLAHRIAGGVATIDKTPKISLGEQYLHELRKFINTIVYFYCPFNAH